MVRICAKIIDNLCKNEVLITAVFEGVDLTRLIARMYVNKDLETARLSFHICKLFSKISRFHTAVLTRKNDIAPAIFQCLKDKDISIQHKKESLQLIPFLLNDSDSIQLFTKNRIEDYMIDFLTNHRYQDGILSQSFKILILLHLSSTILSVGNVGHLFVEKGGMKMMVQIMEERMAEERINWKVVERLV